MTIKKSNEPIELEFTVKKKGDLKPKPMIVRIGLQVIKYKTNKFIFDGIDCVKVEDICRVMISHESKTTTNVKIDNVEIVADVCNKTNEVKEVVVTCDETIRINQRQRPLTLNIGKN